MRQAKRVFILGAGFSKPAGMPLATELIPLLAEELEDDEMHRWLDSLRERLDWLSGCDPQTGSFTLNIEEVFHYAYFDIEVFRLKQHLAPVGRYDGPGTPWNQADSIDSWLSELEYTLCDVIFERENQAELTPITRLADTLDERDTLLTFNYDTLVERALTSLDKRWNHGTGQERDRGIAVCKLHGSIDWIVGDREAPLANCDLLFSKENRNRRGQDTGHEEDDYCLWRCRTREQLKSGLVIATFNPCVRGPCRIWWVSLGLVRISNCTKFLVWDPFGSTRCNR